MPRGKKAIKPIMTKREARRSIKELYWADQIEAYRNSGKSAIHWCQDNNVNIHTMTSWITKLNLQQRKSRLSDDAAANIDHPEFSSQPAEELEIAGVESADVTDAATNEMSVTITPQQSVMTDNLPSSQSTASQAQTSISPPVPKPSTNRQRLVIQYDGITLSAEPGYNKDKMMALLQVLLSPSGQV